MREWLRNDRRWRDRGPVEQRAPCLRTDRAVDRQAPQHLERAHSTLGATAEISIHGTAIESKVAEATLDFRDLVTFRSAAVEHRCLPGLRKSARAASLPRITHRRGA